MFGPVIRAGARHTSSILVRCSIDPIYVGTPKPESGEATSLHPGKAALPVLASRRPQVQETQELPDDDGLQVKEELDAHLSLHAILRDLEDMRVRDQGANRRLFARSD